MGSVIILLNLKKMKDVEKLSRIDIKKKDLVYIGECKYGEKHIRFLVNNTEEYDWGAITESTVSPEYVKVVIGRIGIENLVMWERRKRDSTGTLDLYLYPTACCELIEDLKRVGLTIPLAGTEDIIDDIINKLNEKIN